MYTELNSDTRKTQTTWRRRAGVFICLLALVTGTFAHVGQSAAAPMASEQAAVTAVHLADGSSPENRALAPQHCAPNGQCTVHAVVPLASASGLHGPQAVDSIPEQFPGDHITSPLRLPPKTIETL